MAFFKNILVWIMTGLIAVAAFFCGIFGLEPPTMPDCLTEPVSIVTTTTATTVAPVLAGQWDFTRDEILSLADAFDFEIVTQESTLIPQPQGDPRLRTYTGIRLRDLLEHYGVDVDALAANAYLRVEETPKPPKAGFATDYNINLIRAADTLLAWLEVDGANEDDVIRMCPKYGPAYQFVKGVDRITLFA